MPSDLLVLVVLTARAVVGHVDIGAELRGGEQGRHDDAHVRQELVAEAFAEPCAGLEHVARRRVVRIERLPLQYIVIHVSCSSLLYTREMLAKVID